MEKINNVIKSSTEPEDVHALWLNPDDNSLRAFDFRNGWVSISGGGGEFPTDYARQGDNPDATLSATQAAVNSLSPIASAAEAYNTGKAELAQNITAKGVTASATETLLELAKKVSLISQETTIIDGGEMYAKQQFGALKVPKYWNLYEVLNDLLNNTEASEFGGIILGEFYKGYDSITMGGGQAPSAGTGGGYVFSDEYSVTVDEQGHRTVQFTIHRADGIHTWNDEDNGAGNRWVAWLLAYNPEGTAGMTITDNNTCPRSIFIGRNVGTIKCAVNGRITQIVVPEGNSLTSFEASNYTQPWQNKIVLRGLKEQNGRCFNYSGAESIYLQGDSFSGALTEMFSSYENNALRSFILDAKTLSTGTRLVAYTPQNGSKKFNVLAFFAITNVESCPGYFAFDEQNDSGGDYGIGGIRLPILKEICVYNSEEFRFMINRSAAYCLPNLHKFYLGYKTNDKTKRFVITRGSADVGTVINDIELQNGWCKPLTVSNISLTEDGETNNITEHILKKLKQDEPDCGDGVTITLGSTNLAKLTSQESIDLLDLLTNTYGYTFA